MVKLGELPKISVTIPTYNRKKMLKRAIDSVLAQDYKNIEVIVSDNASTDGTDTLMQEYANDSRIIYIRNSENIGPVKNGRQAKETLPLYIEALNMHLEPEKVTYLLQQSEIAKDKYLLSFLQTQSQSLTQQIKNSLGIKSSIKQLLFSIINKIYKTIK